MISAQDLSSSSIFALLYMHVKVKPSARDKERDHYCCKLSLIIVSALKRRTTSIQVKLTFRMIKKMYHNLRYKDKYTGGGIFQKEKVLTSDLIRVPLSITIKRFSRDVWLQRITMMW